MVERYEDLITSHDQTRAGFIRFALEKNKRSTPFVEGAKAFKVHASKAKCPEDLLGIREIRGQLLTAAGLSDKATKYFTDDDKLVAIQGLIDNFLKPAGGSFVDEAVYRYLLTKGDTLGGTMRNVVGHLAQAKLVRCLLSCLAGLGLGYKWLRNKETLWQDTPDDDYQIEDTLKALSWQYDGKEHLLVLNTNIPIVNKNVDLCLFEADSEDYPAVIKETDKALMFGELKGGIDPAGADEHWKTGSTALNRIRISFDSAGVKVKTCFIAAAIEDAMAREIFDALQNGTLDNAANLTRDEQLIALCDWVVSYVK